jgi:hypothetical protein
LRKKFVFQRLELDIKILTNPVEFRILKSFSLGGRELICKLDQIVAKFDSGDL